MSQENETSEKKTPFEDNWKVGITTGLDWHAAKYGENPVNFEIKDVWKYKLGLKWNFHQWKNNNLSVGVQYFTFNSRMNYNISAEDLPDKIGSGDYKFDGTYKANKAYQFAVDVMYEKYFQLNENSYLFGGIGLEATFGNRDRIVKRASYGQEVDGEFENVDVLYTSHGVQYNNLGLKATFGYAYDSSFGLWRFSLNGFLSGNSFIAGGSELSSGGVFYNNLNLTPNGNAGGKTTGNYIGLGISFYPKKKEKK